MNQSLRGAFLAAGLLAGGGGLAHASDTAEAVFQSLHLVDVMQSIHGAAEDHCYNEGDPTTRIFTGEHPSATRVVAWGVGYSLLHFGVSSWLQDHAPHWTYVAWQAITIGDTGYSVAHNYSIGIRIGKPNTDYPACPQWARP